MFAPPISKPANKSASNHVALHSRAVPLAGRHSGFEYAPLVQPPVNDGPSRTRTVSAGRSAGQEPRDHSWNLCGVPASDPLRRTPELAVGAVDDPLEHEAERVAGDVMRMPAGGLTLSSAPQNISRKSEAGEEEKPQREASGQQPATGEVPAIVREVLRSSGQPLDTATRAFFEPRFKYDFSAVRVHTDAHATESARQINSLAYAVGTDVVFRSDTFAPDTPVGKGLLAHELAHVVQQRHATANGPLSLGRPGDLAEQEAELAATGVMFGRQAAPSAGAENAARVVRRSPGPTPPKPSPPDWLGPLRAAAKHIFGDVWDVRISGLGLTPVGPYDQLKSYLRTFNLNRPPNVEPMAAAHIVGGEHIRDLGWDMSYDKAPCVGVAQSLHDKWSGEMNSHMSQKGMMGGRTTATAGRTIVGPDVVKAAHHEVYRGFPELQDISLRIINNEAKRIMGAKYGMPEPTSPMAAHLGGMPKPKSAMDVHKGSPMPKPKSVMDVHQGAPMPKPKSAMDVHKGSPMPKPKSAMDVHKGSPMPKPKSAMEVHKGSPMPKPKSAMEVHKGAPMPKPKSAMEVHKGSPMPKPKSAMDVHKGAPMPKPKSVMDVHEGSPMPEPKSVMDVHGGGMPEAKSPLEPPTLEPPTLEPPTSGGLAAGGMAMESAAMFEFAVFNLVLPLLFDWMEEGLEADRREAIENALQAAMPEIQAELIRHGVAREPWGEFAAILQQTKGGRAIYANVSCKIELEAPPELRFYLVNLKLSMTKISRYDGGDHYVVSLPVYTPDALATELLRDVPDAL